MANRREMAHRIFAGELSRAVRTHTEDREYSPTYVISETGAKVSRVLVGGVLLDKENLGSEGDPFYRARVEDPTGLFYLRAGQYNPEGAKALAKLEPPCHVLAVGKVRTYSPEPDQVYVSVQPEAIREVPEAHYRRWVMEACASLRTRLEGLKELQQLEEPNQEKLTKLGCSPRVAEGLLLTHQFYGDGVSIESYAGLLYDGLSKMLPEGADMPDRPTASMPPPAAAPAAPTAPAAPADSAALAVEQATDSAATFASADTLAEGEETAAPAPGTPATEIEPAASAEGEGGEIDTEAVTLSLIGGLDTDSEGALWENLAEAALAKGLDSVALDETLNSLRDQGLIYEPTFGRFKLS